MSQEFFALDGIQNVESIDELDHLIDKTVCTYWNKVIEFLNHPALRNTSLLEINRLIKSFDVHKFETTLTGRIIPDAMQALGCDEHEIAAKMEEVKYYTYELECIKRIEALIDSFVKNNATDNRNYRLKLWDLIREDQEFLINTPPMPMFVSIIGQQPQLTSRQNQGKLLTKMNEQRDLKCPYLLMGFANVLGLELDLERYPELKGLLRPN